MSSFLVKLFITTCVSIVSTNQADAMDAKEGLTRPGEHSKFVASEKDLMRSTDLSFDELPPKARQGILKHLPPKELKTNTSLVSKSWAKDCANILDQTREIVIRTPEALADFLTRQQDRELLNSFETNQVNLEFIPGEIELEKLSKLKGRIIIIPAPIGSSEKKVQQAKVLLEKYSNIHLQFTDDCNQLTLWTLGELKYVWDNLSDPAGQGPNSAKARMIRSLRNYQYVISEDKLEEIIKCPFLSNLCVRIINSDNMHKIIEWTIDNGTITSLEIKAIFLDKTQAEAFAKALERNTTLKSLKIKGSNPGIVMPLAKALETNGTLEFLDISCCFIEDAELQAFAKTLEKNKTLRHLKLKDNIIEGTGLIDLAKALKTNRTLEILDLNFNAMSDEAIEVLADAISTNPVLEELGLHLTTFSNKGIQLLSRILRDNTTLKILNLQDSNIDNDGAKILAAALIGNQTLISLNLNLNNIGDEGTIALAKALQVNQKLESLHLNRNNISRVGIQALAKAIRLNQSLKRLYLALNNIDSEGAKALGKALAGNAMLETLDLTYNNLNNLAIWFLTRDLHLNQHLKFLNLSNNNLRSKKTGPGIGINALARVLKANQHLKSLNLSYNPLGAIGQLTLLNALDENETLERLYLLNKDPYGELRVLVKLLLLSERKTASKVYL